LYVRTWVAAALPGADTKLLSESRQLDAKIGVSPKAMQGLRWEISQAHEDVEHVARPALHSVDKRAYVPATG
jgi:hypothetical protein